MNTKLPIFFSMPRSRSTALLTLATPYMENSLGLHSLGGQTEFFQEYSYRYITDDMQRDRKYSMEYFPLNRENSPITHHFVYPAIYNSKFQRTNHKLQVLNQEKIAGREYNIKIMAEDIFIGDNKLDEKYDRNIFDFFSNRKYVITRRKDIKGMSFSLLVSMHTNLWHKRNANEFKYADLQQKPITINPGLCTSIIPSLRAAAMMDLFENYIERSGYSHNTFYYEDLTTVEDMKVALDTVFENKIWREYINDEFIEYSLPKPLNLNYKEIITNYDEINDIIEAMHESIFG